MTPFDPTTCEHNEGDCTMVDCTPECEHHPEIAVREVRLRAEPEEACS